MSKLRVLSSVMPTLLFLPFLLFLPSLSIASDATSKAQTCAACHHAGMNSLAGKGVDHLVAQMKAIRAGDKAHPPVLTDFSDKDIAAVAALLNNGK